MEVLMALSCVSFACRRHDKRITRQQKSRRVILDDEFANRLRQNFDDLVGEPCKRSLQRRTEVCAD
jgi:hypothetical protein